VNFAPTPLQFRKERSFSDNEETSKGDMTAMLRQVVSIFGAVVILIAFACNQAGLWRPNNLAYQGLNLFGSALLAFIAMQEGQAGFVLLEGAWALISFVGLVRVVSRWGSQ
jgi:hypothetical protein